PGRPRRSSGKVSRQARAGLAERRSVRTRHTLGKTTTSPTPSATRTTAATGTQKGATGSARGHGCKKSKRSYRTARAFAPWKGELRRQCNWPQLDRLRELRHKDVSHDWLWHLDPLAGAVLAECDYVPNVVKRLGGRCYEATGPCRICGAPLDPQLEHSEVCPTAEATRGHYACVHALVDGLRLADAAVTTEPRGLTSTQARPADIFTAAAVPGRSAALDVCIGSPNAANAQGDAAEAAFRRKLRRYRGEIQELSAAGIVYRPLVWTADGRPHPAVTRTLAYAAAKAARRGGVSADAKQLQRRWKHEVQVAILRRRAAMARAVLPSLAPRAARLLAGRADGGSGAWGRELPLEEEEQQQQVEQNEDDGRVDEAGEEAGAEEEPTAARG
ncbi:unnamed protein product, partial [Prorocentrum cordatum]